MTPFHCPIPGCISKVIRKGMYVRVTKTMRGTSDTLTGPSPILNRGSLGKIDILRPDTGVLSVVVLDVVGLSGLGIGLLCLSSSCLTCEPLLPGSLTGGNRVLSL